MGHLILFYADGRMEQTETVSVILDEPISVVYYTHFETQPTHIHYLEADTLSFWRPVAYNLMVPPTDYLSACVILKCVPMVLS